MDFLFPETPADVAGRRKVLIESLLGIGDITVLTGAIRELFRAHPRKFAVDVRTSHPELWFYNPFLTTLSDRDPGVERVTCRLEHLIVPGTPEGSRYIDLFLRDFEEQLQVSVRPTRLSGDIHLSAHERLSANPVQQFLGAQVPYWIVGAGGRHEVSVKWWAAERYQQVVDHFRDRILFVQVGLASSHHPPLRGVLDLRGRTSLRELIRLMHAAKGVLCGETSLMHLAAAVPTTLEDQKPICRRPCVVLAGGRLPALLIHYPDHQVIHNAGMLTCSGGGCWKSRTQVLNDGSDLDLPEHRCVHLAGELPRCMDLITAPEVIGRIEGYFRGGVTEYLQGYQVDVARRSDASRNRRGLVVPGANVRPSPSPLLTAPDRLVLLTGADAAMADLLALSGERLETYARQHGYQCRRTLFTAPADRLAYWGKIPEVIQSLRQSGVEWVMWLDADTYITNLDQRIEELLRPGVDLQIGYETTGINCGVFIARVCEWTLRYFETVQFLGTAGHRDDLVGDCLEQTTMRHILKTFPEHQSHVYVEEQHVLNSYLETWQPGDFLLHLAGVPHDSRLRILRRLQQGPMTPTPFAGLRLDARQQK